jgi:hypothetical protein
MRLLKKKWRLLRKSSKRTVTIDATTDVATTLLMVDISRGAIEDVTELTILRVWSLCPMWNSLKLILN